MKWLESGLISMQNARLVRGARVAPCAFSPPPPSPFISDRQPCWIQPPNPFRTLPSPSPSPLSLPYVSRLFHVLVARRKRLTIVITIFIIHSRSFSLLYRYIKYKKKKKKPRPSDISRLLRAKKRKGGKKREKENTFTRQKFTSRTFSVT